jgi:general secretion pathway protein I
MLNAFRHLRAVAGFTLIEMMVALAVFSLAAMALIRLEGATIRGTGILEQTLVAETVARNVAVESITDAQPPAIGPTSGSENNGGRTWTWARQTEPLGDAGAIKIDIAVSEGAGPPIGRLTVIRPPAVQANGPAQTTAAS